MKKNYKFIRILTCICLVYSYIYYMQINVIVIHRLLKILMLHVFVLFIYSSIGAIQANMTMLYKLPCFSKNHKNLYNFFYFLSLITFDLMKFFFYFHIFSIFIITLNIFSLNYLVFHTLLFLKEFVRYALFYFNTYNIYYYTFYTFYVLALGQILFYYIKAYEYITFGKKDLQLLGCLAFILILSLYAFYL